jgi:hypothetical protein
MQLCHLSGPTILPHYWFSYNFVKQLSSNTLLFFYSKMVSMQQLFLFFLNGLVVFSSFLFFPLPWVTIAFIPFVTPRRKSKRQTMFLWLPVAQHNGSIYTFQSQISRRPCHHSNFLSQRYSSVVLNWDGPRRCIHPLSPQGPSRIIVGCYPWFRLHVADTFWISATIALHFYCHRLRWFWGSTPTL